MTIKFLKKGIRVNGEYFGVHYNKGTYKTLPDGTITVYVRGYKSFPDEVVSDPDLRHENDTDLMTDYFDKDRLRIFPGSKYYEQVLKVMG